MGRVASSVGNALIEGFWSTMQRELLDHHAWETRTELASAMFERIEGFYNPSRHHTGLGDISPVAYEALHTRAAIAA
ncbi:IS3 family transposase [Demequina rhizosphaerae]|uniref:IS3 family transposase n=1 Tax=Demequina rhizosphaerae TaxID=1638985 RepID=UPI000785E736|nr:integrase core domain-containing protein [Demequina rhizosphaerae]